MFHQKCLESYTYPKTLKSIELTFAEEEEKAEQEEVPNNSEPSISTKRSSHRKRDGLGRNTLLFFIRRLFLICDREAESNLSFPKSVIGRLRTRDDNDLEHVMNTDSL